MAARNRKAPRNAKMYPFDFYSTYYVTARSFTHASRRQARLNSQQSVRCTVFLCEDGSFSGAFRFARRMSYAEAEDAINRCTLYRADQLSMLRADLAHAYYAPKKS